MKQVNYLVDAICETLQNSEEHLDFIRAEGDCICKGNLQSIVETLQTVRACLSTVKMLHRSKCSEVECERACKNQLFDFIMSENLLERYKAFNAANPAEDYVGTTGADIISKHI